jgi:hypothetical protein
MILRAASDEWKLRTASTCRCVVAATQALGMKLLVVAWDAIGARKQRRRLVLPMRVIDLEAIVMIATVMVLGWWVKLKRSSGAGRHR